MFGVDIPGVGWGIFPDKENILEHAKKENLLGTKAAPDPLNIMYVRVTPVKIFHVRIKNKPRKRE